MEITVSLPWWIMKVMKWYLVIATNYISYLFTLLLLSFSYTDISYTLWSNSILCADSINCPLQRISSHQSHHGRNWTSLFFYRKTPYRFFLFTFDFIILLFCCNYLLVGSGYGSRSGGPHYRMVELDGVKFILALILSDELQTVLNNDAQWHIVFFLIFSIFRFSL